MTLADIRDPLTLSRQAKELRDRLERTPGQPILSVSHRYRVNTEMWERLRAAEDGLRARRGHR